MSILIDNCLGLIFKIVCAEHDPRNTPVLGPQKTFKVKPAVTVLLRVRMTNRRIAKLVREINFSITVSIHVSGLESFVRRCAEIPPNIRLVGLNLMYNLTCGEVPNAAKYREMFSHCTDLQHLGLCGPRRVVSTPYSPDTPKHEKAIWSGLQSCTWKNESLTSLKLSNHGGATLPHEFPSTLTRFEVDSVGLFENSNERLRLFEQIQGMCLQKLTVTGSVTENLVPLIGPLLPTSLTKLDLSNNDVSTQMTRLSCDLTRLSSLQTLHLNNIGFPRAQLTCLLALCQANTKLSTVSLHRNGFQGDDIRPVWFQLEALRDMTLVHPNLECFY